jgi:hypothetical protein
VLREGNPGSRTSPGRSTVRAHGENRTVATTGPLPRSEGRGKLRSANDYRWLAALERELTLGASKVGAGAAMQRKVEYRVTFVLATAE